MKTIFTVFLMVTTALGLAQKQFVNYFENGNILEKGTLVDGKRNGNIVFP
jgi:antitoxin component YwqK of YwqJK toxin-antitoxin module